MEAKRRTSNTFEFSCNIWSIMSHFLDHDCMTHWPNIFLFSPTPHLHFSIKHPHTLSWEYYKMFQCKAHLVMRLIENRISMEFMLQVRHSWCCLVFRLYNSLCEIVKFMLKTGLVFIWIVCFLLSSVLPSYRFSTSFWALPAQPHPRSTRVKCGARCFCLLTPSSNPSPTSLAKT